MAGKENLWNDLPMAVLGLFASHWGVPGSEMFVVLEMVKKCL